MTTSQSSEGGNTVSDETARARLEGNMVKVDHLTKRLLAAMSHKRHVPQDLQAPSAELYLKAAGAYWQEVMTNPAKLMEAQVGYWGKVLNNYIEAQKALAEGRLQAPEDGRPARRPMSPTSLVGGETIPISTLVKETYLANGRGDPRRPAPPTASRGLDARDSGRGCGIFQPADSSTMGLTLDQFFLGTNPPDALRKGDRPDGEAWIQGLENSLSWVGWLVLVCRPRRRLRSRSVENMRAPARIKVVFRNRMGGA